MIIAKNLKYFKISNKKKTYMTFVINFILVKNIFAYQFFKKSLNQYFLGKNNMANI